MIAARKKLQQRFMTHPLQPRKPGGLICPITARMEPLTCTYDCTPRCGRAASVNLRPLLAPLALRSGRRPLAKEGSHRLLRPECACLGLTVERARRQRARRDRRVVESGWSKVAESASFGGGALEHPRQWLGAQWPGFSRWVCCTAQSHQARPEEAQEPKPGTAEGCILAMLLRSSVTQAWSEACGGV